MHFVNFNFFPQNIISLCYVNEQKCWFWTLGRLQLMVEGYVCISE